MEMMLQQLVLSLALAIVGVVVFLALFNVAMVLSLLRRPATRAWWGRRIWNMRGLFWLVNGVCMLFSTQNAGYLFGIYEPLTGWAVGLVLDLLIIVFTQSMLHALARGEKGRAAQILGFIFACTLISFLGNLAHNLHVSAGDAFTGVWFVVLLPYAASVMPFFLVALAWVSDLKGNPLETMNVQEYAALEQKQADFLRVQVEQREQRAALQTRLIAVEQMERQNKRLRKRKLPKTFRWFWEQPADLETMIAVVATQLKHMFDPDLLGLKEQKQARANPAQDISSSVTDLRLWRDEREGDNHDNQQDGCVPNGLTSDLFEENMTSDQEPSSLPIMYLHSIPHTVRFSAQKNAYQGSDDGEDH
ncbi:MAG: hypothetical protein J2P36_07980, partial [Ktedonobacteraceae bacterium]|nr:hypothetical protein [Ktedonobacteraceae bacterium]